MSWSPSISITFFTSVCIHNELDDMIPSMERGGSSQSDRHTRPLPIPPYARPDHPQRAETSPSRAPLPQIPTEDASGPTTTNIPQVVRAASHYDAPALPPLSLDTSMQALAQSFDRQMDVASWPKAGPPMQQGDLQTPVASAAPRLEGRGLRPPSPPPKVRNLVGSPGYTSSGYASDISTGSFERPNPSSKVISSTSPSQSISNSPRAPTVLSPNNDLPLLPMSFAEGGSKVRSPQLIPSASSNGRQFTSTSMHLRAPSAHSYLVGSRSPDGYASSGQGSKGSPNLSSAAPTSDEEASSSDSEGDETVEIHGSSLPRYMSSPFDLRARMQGNAKPDVPHSAPTKHLSLKRAGGAPKRSRSNAGSSSFAESDPGPSEPAELLPDLSNANRRLPTYDGPTMTSAKATFQTFAACADTIVTATGHKVKIYRSGSQPRDDGLAEKQCEVGEKDGHRISALAFRPVQNEKDVGRYVWVGTASGNIWELDTLEEKVTGSRSHVHGEAVIKMVRVGNNMFCLDESGKTSVWMPRKGEDGVVVPVTLESQPFAQRVPFDPRNSVPIIVADELWVGTGSSAGRKQAKVPGNGPRVNVYNPFAEDKPFNALSRPSAIPLEMSSGVGAITSGAIVPSMPHLVYLAHETGHISTWSRERFICISVAMCARGGITALAGVGSTLWSSNKSGKICVYDTSETPFKVLKLWPAHRDAVTKLLVDTYSISIGRLQVASGGSDGQVKLWDGLLATDWYDTELNKQETKFCTYRSIKTLHLTWNLDAVEPSDLNVDRENVEFLPRFLQSTERPDIVVFGLQELIDLGDKRLTAKSLLMGKKRVGNELGDRISSQYRDWKDKLTAVVELAMPEDDPYVLVHSEFLVGLMTCIFVRKQEAAALRDTAIATIKTGLGGRYGNKGAIVARVVIDDSSLCFVNCHLAAGQRRVRQRNENVLAIIEEEEALPPGESTMPSGLLAYTGGGNGEMILDHEAVFFSGDLNYRIDLKRDRCIDYINKGKLSPLLDADQLRREMFENPRFRLKTFEEAPISFAPTYKYNKLSNDWDSSEKKRAPAWCDRILWRDRGLEKVKCLQYRRWEPTVSDHRPV